MKFLMFVFGLILLVSCKDQVLIPKPPLYLRTDLPEPSYQRVEIDCPYSFELSTIYQLKDVKQGAETTCHKDIDLGALNGVVNFSYIAMTEPLATYVNYANDKVDEHKIKATGIESENILHPEKKVYGTIFKLQGDVATPFQFYLTDSISNFASGVVYFNSVPNYDSIRPTLDYLERDLYHLMNSFEWKK